MRTENRGSEISGKGGLEEGGIPGRLSAGFAGLAVIVGPWFFGAWEMWWFWPFVFCIFASTALFSARLFLERNVLESAGIKNGKLALGVVTLCLPFLIYACARFVQADVYIDAERSVLLFLTPFLVGSQIILGWSRRQIRLLFILIAANLCLLGLYGIANHYVTGSKLVLWEPGYDMYTAESRATGSYYCPDHFSGIMELAICLGLGLVLTRNSRGLFDSRERSWSWTVMGAALCVVGLWGVLLSKSRGGGLTVMFVLALTPLWGFSQWKPSRQWAFRAGTVVAAVLLAVGVWRFGGAYTKRFVSHFRPDYTKETQGEGADCLGSCKRVVAGVLESLNDSSRYRMITGALRAWKTSPMFGIGPGMHQNLWFHFAASPDGDRAGGIWPKQPNWDFHSFEVHSDWVQLMEEYGLVGLVLFMAAALVVCGALLVGHHREVSDRARNGWADTGRSYHAATLGGMLSFWALAFHSLGDFNLQMPATAWLLSAVIAIPIAFTVRDGGR